MCRLRAEKDDSNKKKEKELVGWLAGCFTSMIEIKISFKELL